MYKTPSMESVDYFKALKLLLVKGSYIGSLLICHNKGNQLVIRNVGKLWLYDGS